MFENLSLAFGAILENLRKYFESSRKSSENHQKRRHHYVYIIIRYEFYVLVARTISHEWAKRTSEILFLLPLEHRIHIFSPPCNILYIIYRMTHVRQGHYTYDLEFANSKLSSPEHASAYMMAANTGVIKAIVSFYPVNWDTAFERHRDRFPINDLNTGHALKSTLFNSLVWRN